MVKFIRLIVTFYLLLSCFVCFSAKAQSVTNLQIYTYGTPSLNQPCKPVHKSIALMGGGLDVLGVYPWLINKASECGEHKQGMPGNFLIIRAEGNGEYYKPIYDLGTVASVLTLVIPDSKSANDPKLDEIIKNASVIWLTGGDQRIYYDEWKGSRLLSLIKEKILYGNVPFGGASAGMMLLGNYIHVGNQNHILSSTEALNNPYNPYMVLGREFWPSTSDIIEDAPYIIFSKTIIDSHFDTRNRMGRTLTFIARNLADHWSISKGASVNFVTQSHAIAVDGETAVLIEENSDGEYEASILVNPNVSGSAYFINPTQYPLCAKTRALLSSSCKTSITFNNIQINRLIGSKTQSKNLFNLTNWQTTEHTSKINFEHYEININAGHLSSRGNSGQLY